MKIFRMLLPALLLAIFLFSSCTQGESKSQEYDGEVQTALAEIKKQWQNLYDQIPDLEPYLEVKNTRLIFLRKDNEELLEDTHMIVEFILYSNYMGSAPYYDDAGQYNCVAFYEDGSMEVLRGNPFNEHRSRTYSSDFSGIIDSIEDCGSAYDQIIQME